MKFDKEVKINQYRIDYKLTLEIGVEVKSPSEFRPRELARNISKYLDSKLDHLVLLIRDVSDISMVDVNELISHLPGDRVSVAVGSEYNPLTWRSVYDKMLIEIIKQAFRG